MAPVESSNEVSAGLSLEVAGTSCSALNVELFDDDVDDDDDDDDDADDSLAVGVAGG